MDSFTYIIVSWYVCGMLGKWTDGWLFNVWSIDDTLCVILYIIEYYLLCIRLYRHESCPSISSLTFKVKRHRSSCPCARQCWAFSQFAGNMPPTFQVLDATIRSIVMGGWYLKSFDHTWAPERPQTSNHSNLTRLEYLKNIDWCIAILWGCHRPVDFAAQCLLDESSCVAFDHGSLDSSYYLPTMRHMLAPKFTRCLDNCNWCNLISLIILVFVVLGILGP